MVTKCGSYNIVVTLKLLYNDAAMLIITLTRSRHIFYRKHVDIKWLGDRTTARIQPNLFEIVLVNLVVRFHYKCLQLVSQFTNLSYVQIDRRLGRLPKRLFGEIDVNGVTRRCGAVLSNRFRYASDVATKNHLKNHQ